MKTSFILTSLAAALSASAQLVTFGVVDEKNNNLGLPNNLHSGAGFDFYFVGANQEILQYNIDNNGVATLNVNYEYPFHVGAFENYFAVGPAVTPANLEIVDNKITNWNFWACYDTSDPYNYSAKNRAIVVNEKGNSTAPGSQCIPVFITVLDVVY
ncbi:hypothetical protein PUMCH_004311 [Australozyma saopauloensis]|uniref:Uncharacterized protein n=1 Tax=Australozyma saopauloensis TaxID=291208 RepID=A0AAX4HE92_9ASCO|nr:hypothetical protein PUMCH_004311 [[Candida] saopauloensis]